MSFWEAVSGKLAKYRRLHFDISKLFYRRLKTYLAVLAERYPDHPDYVCAQRNRIVSMFQSICASTSEGFLGERFLSPYREKMLGLSLNEFCQFHAAFQAENFFQIVDNTSPTEVKLPAFLDAFEGLEQTYDLTNYRALWMDLLDTCDMPREQFILVASAKKCSMIRAIVGIPTITPDVLAHWHLFTTAVGETARTLASSESFDEKFQTVMALYDRY